MRKSILKGGNGNKDYLYLIVSVKKNVGFYENNGFGMVQTATKLQILKNKV